MIVTRIAALLSGPSLYKGLDDGNGHVDIHSISQLPIILGNVVEILLTLIAVLAVIYIMYGGIQYIISQGDSSKTAAAKTGIANAVVGLLLSAMAYLLVDFVVGRFH